MRRDTDDYRQIFLDGAPLLDTRAPVEFACGAFPGAVNLPLLTDSEREQVGIRYKQRGQAAAIQLGEQLLSASLRQQRLDAWCEFARHNPDGYLYCFRGGLRSRMTQRWMREVGQDYPLIEGGYKAMRRFLIAELQRSLDAIPLVLIAGRTGAGKTRLIEQLAAAVDLEGLARHRGSSFGRLTVPQPGQIDFENALGIALLHLRAGEAARVFMEDEGKCIGRLGLPEVLRKKMSSAAMLVLEEPVGQRVEVILEDYIDDLGARYRAIQSARGPAAHHRHLRDGLDRIRKRLGGELHRRIGDSMAAAFAAASPRRARQLHARWIETLLVEYYDPMYDYQIGLRGGRVLARGCREEIISAARHLAGSDAC